MTLLQEANRTNQVEVKRIDKLVEDIFALDGIPDPVYEKLTEISKLLLSTLERLG